MSATTSVLAVVKAEARFGPEGMVLWRLGGLKPGKTPAWFRRIVQRDFDGHFNAHWFDHHAKSGEALVAEPYDIDDGDLRDLVAFADKYDLNISISAITHHFPTRTLSIFLTPRERKAA
jgi:hypothetical protein